jgi:Patatin phospholipase
MREHWAAGYHDAMRTLRHPEVLQRPDNHEGVFAFDLHSDSREGQRTAGHCRRSAMSDVHTASMPSRSTSRFNRE